MATPELLGRFIQPLEGLNLRYMVTGSVAAMAYGEPRLTSDIDVVVALAPHDAGRIARAFAADDLYVPPEEVIRDAVTRGDGASFNVVWPARALKADYFPAADALAAWGLERRRQERVEDRLIWLAPPEYVIVRKLQYHAMGESAKHLDDIRSMLRFAADRIDQGAIELQVTRLALDEPWGRALRRQGNA